MKKVYTSLVATLIICLMMIPKDEPVDYIYRDEIDLKSFKVEVKGPFPYAGTYEFYEPLTVGEILLFAGEPYEEIDESRIFRTTIISSNQTITIYPKYKEHNDKIVLVNINKASFSELLTIPHMTESRAISLLVYREANGPFMSINDLIHVKYIGVVTLENIRPYITTS